jgi:uncharacterized membrane protein YccC
MTELEKALSKTLNGLEQGLSDKIQDHEQRLTRQEAELKRVTTHLRESEKLFNDVGELYRNLQDLLLRLRSGG